MPAVSVLLSTRDPGADLQPLVQSLDAQTLPVAEFQVVVVDASTDGSTVRLQHLAEHRPNVVVLTGTASLSEAERLALALEQATGDWVVPLRQRQLLAPRALELLAGQDDGADVVAGRVVTASSSSASLLGDDPHPADGLLAVRRAFLDGRDDPAGALLDPAGIVADATVATIGPYACAIEPGPAAPAGAEPQRPTIWWADGALHLTVRIRLTDPVAPAPPMWLVLAHDAAEVAVPAVPTALDQDGSAFDVAAVVDPATAASGHPLDDGRWHLRLRIGLPGGEVTAPLSGGPARPAVVDGRPSTVASADGVLHLDAGATRTGVVGRVPSSRTSVTESARGALLAFDCTDVHVRGDADLAAKVLLGTFAVPAVLRCRDGAARLEAYIGTLAGSTTVSVATGGGKPKRTGLRLHVDGVGRMTLTDAPVKPSAPAASTLPLVQRVRRMAPEAVEPAVRRLSQVPVLRRTYRRLLDR